MSTIKTNTLTGTTTAGSISVTGEGNSTTTNLQQGLAKSWLFFNQGGPTVTASFNVSSVTDTSTGLYDQNLTSAMAGTTDLCFSGLGHHNNSDTNARDVAFQRDKRGTHTSSSIPFESFDHGDGNSLGDEEFISTQVLGDLA
jgi:hypothetical protein